MTTLTQFFKSSAKVQTAMGISIAIFGVLTMFVPVISSVVFTQLLTLLLAGASIATTVYAFKMPKTKQKVVHFISGVIGLVAAVFIYQAPILGMYTITAAAIGYLIIDGLFTLITAIQQRKQKGIGWVFFNAFCSLVLAGLLITDWPLSGLYAVSMFIGVKLIANGWSYAMLSFVQYSVSEKLEKIKP